MANTAQDGDARFRDLEARIAEQEKAISELSDELYRQQRHVALLDTQVRHLVERIKTLTAEPAPSPQDEMPPALLEAAGTAGKPRRSGRAIVRRGHC